MRSNKSLSWETIQPTRIPARPCALETDPVDTLFLYPRETKGGDVGPEVWNRGRKTSSENSVMLFFSARAISSSKVDCGKTKPVGLLGLLSILSHILLL
jgi:hypothetical protein